ncbi:MULTISPECIES: hypothetical protein [Halobellus]|uniref:hypothetical protein n=1 Tax=Halobellus TaxID=1073986 RepID=UPI00210D2E13|nr:MULTISPECIES: hypothetical protein [Halobellus]MDQ2053742.1 hypothetical protein [Halobellus sp. H-GB7]
MDSTDAVNSEPTNERDEAAADSTVDISAHQSSPDRVVFTEDGNSDGWIAFDAESVVALHR